MFRRIRELKREVKELAWALKLWKKYADDNVELKKEVAKIIKINEGLGKEIEKYRDEVRESELKYDKVVAIKLKEIAELEDQTETKLFLSAAKICVKLLIPERKQLGVSEREKMESCQQTLRDLSLARQQLAPDENSERQQRTLYNYYKTRLS